MGKPATTRLGIPQYEDSEVAEFSTQANAISTTVDSRALRYDEGTHAGRPAAGIKGRIYYETDTKLAYYDNGSAWIQLLLGSTSVAFDRHTIEQGKEQEPSATHQTFVTINFELIEGSAEAKAIGEVVGYWGNQGWHTLSFILPAASKWVVDYSDGDKAGGYIFATYLAM